MSYTRPFPVFDTLTGTERQSVPPLKETYETSYVKLADASRSEIPGAVVVKTGFGVLAETPRAAAEEGARDGVGDGATALGLTEADGVGLESADALALAATEDTECATAALFPVPAPAHALTLAASTTAPATATAAARSRDPLLNTRPSPT